MVLSFHGKDVAPDEIRRTMSIGRDGTNALSIINAANFYGLRARGIKIELEELPLLDPGTILHWEFNHFVVFERVKGDTIEIVDPASGRTRLSTEKFSRSFTGVALLFEPSEVFESSSRETRSTRQWLRRTLAGAGDWRRILVVSVFLQLFALSLPILTGAIVDRVVPRADLGLLSVLCIGLIGTISFYFVASMIRSHLLIELRTICDARMTLGFLDYLLRLPYSYFLERSAGDLMMRVNSNAVIRELLTSGFLSAVLDGALVVLYWILIWAVSFSFGILVSILASLQIAIVVFSRRRQEELLGETLRKQARAESYLVEVLAGIETLKAMGTELRAAEQWSNYFVDQLNVSIERARVSAFVDSLNGALRMGCPLVILAFGAWQVLHGRMTLGTVLALSALSGTLLGPLSNLVANASQFMLLGQYIHRLEDILAEAPEQPSDQARLPVRLKGDIRLDNVTFRYTRNSPPVIRDVSLQIKSGQFVAIVGRSGSGKSTLAHLLLGLYIPESGHICFDNVNINTLDLRSLRQQLGIVNQRTYLFGASIKSNIASSDPKLSIEKIVEAATIASIDQEIRTMPMEYDTVLLDGGASLSGGQRQRLALARALVREPSVLLLDEATSALDAITERAIHDNLSRLSCTRIVIAHRLSTIRNADLILVLENGRIVEQGSHADLIGAGGAYAALVASQIGSVEAQI